MGSYQGVLDPQGPVSSAERLILLNATAIMLVVVVPVIVLTLAFAWWYRASNTRAAYEPDWAYSGKIELVVWSIPAMVVILLAGVAWIGSHELDPQATLHSDAKPLRIQAVSLDWKWLFIYPDLHIAAVNELVVPAGTPLEFSLTSATVMNAFFVPQLGTQIYTMPGMTTHLNLMADRAGEYPGLSSHFSGNGFSDMHFVVRAVTAPAFDGWLAHTRGTGPPLDLQTYGRLASPGGGAGPETYGSVTPMLFERVMETAAPMKTSASSTTAAPMKTSASSTTAAPMKTSASSTTAAPMNTSASSTTAAPMNTSASSTTAAPITPAPRTVN
jgi:cytochrome o ubiquinol oxidase subunit 2